MGNGTPALQYSPGPSEHHTAVQILEFTQRKDARESFEFWRLECHPETHHEQTRWGSRHHNTPAHPTALCKQKMTSPEPNLWLFPYAVLGLLCLPQTQVTCLIWPSGASSSIWQVPQTGLQWDTLLRTKHSPSSRLHQVICTFSWVFVFPTDFNPACWRAKIACLLIRRHCPSWVARIELLHDGKCTAKTEYRNTLFWGKKYDVRMWLFRWHLFAFFYKQNRFIKTFLSNSSVFSPGELSSIRLPTGLAELQQALLRLPLVHSLAQSTLPQQGSLSALNAPCFFLLSLPWALAQNWSSPTSMLPLSLSERLFLCRVLPNTAKVLPSLAAEVLKSADWGRSGRALVPSFALGDLGVLCTLPEVPNGFCCVPVPQNTFFSPVESWYL